MLFPGNSNIIIISIFPKKADGVSAKIISVRGFKSVKKYTWVFACILLVVGALGFYTGKQYFWGIAKPTGVSIYQSEKEDPAKNKGNQNSPASFSPVAPTLSNTSHGWGIKRNDNHQQPEMPSGIHNTLARYNAYWIGSPKEKVLYLTFDEGYENGFTPKILDILKANNVKAAFFVTGHYVKSQPELVKRMVAEGHIVGNHTMTHPNLPDISDEQIKQELLSVEELFTKLTGRKMRYLRPPKGEYSERTLAVTRNLGYHNIFWSLALVDWVPMAGGPQEAYQSVMDNLHNGAVILLHAVSKDNTEALDRIL